jgi:hypothetical protein
MPCSHTVDPAEGIVRTVISGRVSLQDCYNTTTSLMSDPSLSPKMRHLVDLSEMDFLPSVRESIEFSNLLISRRDALQSRIAVVFSDPLLGGLVRLACDYVRILGIPMQAFRSTDHALEWLLENERANGNGNGTLRKAS